MKHELTDDERELEAYLAEAKAKAKPDDEEHEIPGEIRLLIAVIAAIAGYQFLHSIDWRAANLWGAGVATWALISIVKD